MNHAGAWLRHIRTAWVIGFSLVFFLNIDQFGFSAGLVPAPKFWSAGVFLITLGLFLPRLKPARLLRAPLFWWALGYLLLSVVWIGIADDLDAAKEGLVLVITTCMYTGVALLAYPDIDPAGRVWNGMLWIALFLAIASLLQEYFDPATYVFAAAGQGIPGRAAGLYLNPNIAAQALVMILVCKMSSGSRSANLVASLVVLIGLFFTFSRAGLLAWAALLMLATVFGRLPRWFLLGIALCAAMILFAGHQLFDALSELVSPENRDSLGRLAWLLGQGNLSDYSAGEREYVAAYGWQQFLQAPLVGHGLGYVWVWSADVATHNLILRHLVEYGIVGVLIFPSFLYCSIRSGSRDNTDAWRWMGAGIALLLSMFTHNMLEQANFVLPWLAICLMPMKRAEPIQVRSKQ